MADALERLTNLLALLLETRQPLTLDRIAHELEGQYPADGVARRGAFERDKAVLRAEGIPLETVTTHDGGTAYRVDRRRYELADLGLTPDETRALQVAVATVHLGHDWAEGAMLKLGGGTAPPAAAAPVTALPGSPALAVLFQANAERAPVTFEYRGARRTLDPYGLLTRHGFWYVVGRDHGRDELRTFRVDRIGPGEPELGEAGSFERPEGFDVAEAVIADGKAMGDGPAEALVLVAAGRAAPLVAELGDASVRERRADGAVVVSVPCANPWAFRSWLLEMADQAEVLGPADVRADVVAWLQAIVAAGAGR
jgi:predicted DNA-binding transcriptional regulator YafY